MILIFIVIVILINIMIASWLFLVMANHEVVEDLHHIVVLMFWLVLVRSIQVLVDVAELERFDLVGPPYI